MNTTDKEIYNNIKEKSLELAKQFEKNQKCYFIVEFEKGVEYSFKEDSIILKQDLVAYVEIMGNELQLTSISFESTQYGNGIGEGAIGYVLMSSKDYFSKIDGPKLIRVRLPYTNDMLIILIKNIEQLPFTVEKSIVCDELTFEGDIVQIEFPEHLVTLQEEYMAKLKSLNIPTLFKTEDYTENQRRIILNNIYKKVYQDIQEAAKEQH
jgi:hypothetical protein